MRIASFFILTAACGFAPSIAGAQRVPFFSPAGTGFDPEISVVNSGQVLDAQPVVSKDMKYVTINARASSSQLLALRDFSFQTGGNRRLLGFVGGVANGGRRPGMLDQSGMTMVSGLD